MAPHRHNTRLGFLCVCLCFCLCGQAQDTLRLSLDSCLSYAYRHNGAVRIAQLAVESAEVSLHSARWQFLPKISSSAGEYWSKNGDQYSSDYNVGAYASVTLFDGMNRWNNYRQSTLTLQQSRLRTQHSRRSAGEQVGNAYLTLLMALEKLHYQLLQLENCRQLQAEGLLRYKVGKILESDYLLLQTNLLRAKSEADNLRLTVEECRLTLQSLLNLPENVVLDIMPLDLNPYDTILPPISAVMRSALESQPDIKVARIDVEIARVGVRAARSVYLPSLSLSAGGSFYGGNQGLVDDFGRVITQSGLNSNIGFSLSIPILNYSGAGERLKQSKINLRQAEIEQERQTNEFRQAVTKTYLATRQSLNNYLSSKELEKAYRANYEVYRKRYDEGKVGIVELLRQQDSYLDALNECLQNKYTYILNMKLLELIQNEL